MTEDDFATKAEAGMKSILEEWKITRGRREAAESQKAASPPLTRFPSPAVSGARAMCVAIMLMRILLLPFSLISEGDLWIF